MKKKYVTLMIVVIMLVTASVAYAAPQDFAATLSGEHEVPPRAYGCDRRCHLPIERRWNRAQL